MIGVHVHSKQHLKTNQGVRVDDGRTMRRLRRLAPLAELLLLTTISVFNSTFKLLFGQIQISIFTFKLTSCNGWFTFLACFLHTLFHINCDTSHVDNGLLQKLCLALFVNPCKLFRSSQVQVLFTIRLDWAMMSLGRNIAKTFFNVVGVNWVTRAVLCKNRDGWLLLCFDNERDRTRNDAELFRNFNLLLVWHGNREAIRNYKYMRVKSTHWF